MKKHLTGAEYRQYYIDFFKSKGHTFVASSSLVPGGDATLLFTNAGMVQFKDVFLGTDLRPYTRAVNSQKCMRVAGKHNDLDDVGRDGTHHTFFEMLGNWSFGDYYKKEAIQWAWELITERWGLDKTRLWASVFRDDIGNVPEDDEAAQAWLRQPGFEPEHLVYSGRKDNFWEMAETGPCGPCSEIHYDRGPSGCNRQGVPGHVCEVNGDCTRYLEFWNLVFIQYNRLGPDKLEQLPATHVDTGMGLDRITSLLQGVDSTYETDLLTPVMDCIQELTGDTPEERAEHNTPYRVIADHSRAAAFLIADGVVPGNTGRNYICRMIIRRAARFGSKVGLTDPFLAKTAGVIVRDYGEAFPELRRNEKAILNSITREEQRFQRTVEAGLSRLSEFIDEYQVKGLTTLDGKRAFDLYATLGLPLELIRDVAREEGLGVDEAGFKAAMEDHRTASGAGKAMGLMSGEGVEAYREVLEDLQAAGTVSPGGVSYDPYNLLEVETPLAAIFMDGAAVDAAEAGDKVEVLLPQTGFYVESGGQVSDTGSIVSVSEPRWEIRVDGMRRPAAGVIVHTGMVLKGNPRAGDLAIAAVDAGRRQDIMRNHTATHLLHAALHEVLGEHARQAGSLVAPDRLRFDFNHPEAVTPAQLEEIEQYVNRTILEGHSLDIRVKGLQEAITEGATALFGEKYGEEVRTISIGGQDRFSYELCGGTHVSETNDIGVFLITSEGSAAAGIRRIEAVTGRKAYELIQHRFHLLKETAAVLSSAVEDVAGKARSVLDDLDQSRREALETRQAMIRTEFEARLKAARDINGIMVLGAVLPEADADTLRQMTDLFRAAHPNGAVVLGSSIGGRPLLVASSSEAAIQAGLNAGDIVRAAAREIGGSGGGKPGLAQAGGKDPQNLPKAVETIYGFAREKGG